MPRCKRENYKPNDSYTATAVITVPLSFFSSLFALLGGLSRLSWLSWLSWLSSLLTAASTATTSSTLVSTLGTLLAVTLALLLLIGGQVGNRQSLREIDLGSDSVGQVADHEDVLDVVVEVVLDLGSIDLGGQRQGAQEVLGKGVVGLLVLV